MSLRPVREQRRAEVLNAMADHMLTCGLAGSPLRALAHAAGTSDRMLLYYFADKNELLTTLLEYVAARLVRMLETETDNGRYGFAELLDRLWVAARTPAFRPYMLLFLELAATAGRGAEPHRTAAGRIAASFITWVAARLDAADNDLRGQAALLLATLDGLFLLHCAGQEDAADGAAVAITTRQQLSVG